MPLTQPRFHDVLCTHPLGLHRLAYAEWGDRDNPRVLLCVHGLTRSGHDFAAFARALAPDYRVVCPDMPGRGRSDWLADPTHYSAAQYVADCITLIARLGVASVDWLGTSMGGLVGIVLASYAGAPLRRMVLNDVGPEIEPGGIDRISSYVGDIRPYASFEEGLAHVLSFSAGFGPHTSEQWAEYNREYVVFREGRWRIHYDPAIAVLLRAAQGSPAQTLWPLWEAITCPTLVLRGEHSDILSRATVERMRTTGPRATGVEIPLVGHAPTLLTEAQIAPVRAFLNAP